MKVVFNVDAITAPLTGIGRYALELARGLGASEEIEALKLFSIYRFVDDPDAALDSNRPFAALRRMLPFKSLALEAYTALRSGLFRARTRGFDGWLLHTPNYVLMPFDGPSLTTVHDLSWLRYPETHPVERVRFLERHLPRSLEQATLVLTDSAYIADEIHERLGVPRGKLRVVPLGVDASFHPRDADRLAPVLARHGLAGRAYLLVVATQEPRKNLARLARAYARLPDALRARHPLVVAGARGWLNAELEPVLAPLEARGEALRLGYVEEAELPLLYAGAHAFAFPSLYEGFGLPLLEAFASGIPVLTSNGSSLAELATDVQGAVALAVDPLDEDALLDGLERLLLDGAWREAAVPRARAVAAAHPWSRCVAGTIAAYREVLAPRDVH